MNIYENNKQLLTAMGGDSANLATDYEVRKAILDLLGGDSSTCNSIYEVDKQILNIYLEGGGGTGGGKAKVTGFYISSNCIVDGTWSAESIDTSLVSDMGQKFSSLTTLKSLDLSGWDTSKVTNMYRMFGDCNNLQSVGDISGWNTENVSNMFNMFSNCSSLTNLDVSGWDTSKVTDMNSMFYYCRNLQSVDLSGFDVSNVTTMTNAFSECGKNYGSFNSVGGRTIEEVISGNVGILNGLKITVNSHAIGQFLDRASLRALINGIADLTGSTSQILHLSSLTAKLTEEDIAIATAKNWTITSY